MKKILAARKNLCHSNLVAETKLTGKRTMPKTSNEDIVELTKLDWPAIPTHHGIYEIEPGEAMYAWVLFDKKDILDIVEEYGEDMNDLAFALTGWSCYSYGPGRAFGNEPYAKIGRNRVLVKQRRGLDI